MFLPNDRRLLERFRAGDRDAMTVVFEHYCTDLRSFLQRGFVIKRESEAQHIRGLRSRHELHDIVAETFRRAFEERARLAYGGLSPYSAYLRQIARNLLIDRARSRSSKWIPLDENPGALVEEELAAAAPTPEETYRRKELVTVVAGCLDELSVEQRELVRLRYHEGLAQQQVADQMKKSRRWVRKQEVSLRKHLLRRMGKTGLLPPQRSKGPKPGE